jgi:hypothetical protein
MYDVDSSNTIHEDCHIQVNLVTQISIFEKYSQLEFDILDDQPSKTLIFTLEMPYIIEI